jgi:hypothetical protein
MPDEAGACDTDLGDAGGLPGCGERQQALNIVEPERPCVVVLQVPPRQEHHGHLHARRRAVGK